MKQTAIKGDEERDALLVGNVSFLYRDHYCKSSLHLRIILLVCRPSSKSPDGRHWFPFRKRRRAIGFFHSSEKDLEESARLELGRVFVPHIFQDCDAGVYPSQEWLEVFLAKAF